jgi:hypothetical protein
MARARSEGRAPAPTAQKSTADNLCLECQGGMRTWLREPGTGTHRPGQTDPMSIRAARRTEGRAMSECGQMPAGGGSESDGAERPFKRLPITRD